MGTSVGFRPVLEGFEMISRTVSSEGRIACCRECGGAAVSIQAGFVLEFSGSGGGSSLPNQPLCRTCACCGQLCQSILSRRGAAAAAVAVVGVGGGKRRANGNKTKTDVSHGKLPLFLCNMSQGWASVAENRTWAARHGVIDKFPAPRNAVVAPPPTLL